MQVDKSEIKGISTSEEWGVVGLVPTDLVGLLTLRLFVVTAPVCQMFGFLSLFLPAVVEQAHYCCIVVIANFTMW